MRQRGWSSVLVAVMALLAVMVGAGPGSAAVVPPSETPLPFLWHASAMVVDDARQQLFISEGATGTRVLQIDLAGNVLNTLTGFSGPTGMAISGSDLYVVQDGSDEIQRWTLSTDPPSKLGDISIAPLTDPESPVVSDGKIVFLACQASVGKIAWMDPDGSAQGAIDRVGCPSARLVVGDALPGAVFYALTDSTLRFDFDAGALVQAWGMWDPVRYVMANGDLLGVGRLDIHIKSYDPNTQAVTHDFGYSESGRNGVFAYTPGKGGVLVDMLPGPDDDYLGIRSLSSSNLDNTRPTPFLQNPALLVLTPDASRLFWLSVNRSTGALTLRSADPLVAVTSITLATPSKPATYGIPFDLTGSLVGGTVVPAGSDVLIYEVPQVGEPTFLGSTATAPGGSFSFQVAPAGSTAYRATYEGSATLEPSASSVVALPVMPNVTGQMKGYSGQKGKYFQYRRSQRVAYEGSVAPDHTGSVVQISLQYLDRRDGWSNLASKKFALGSGSSISIWLSVKSWPAGTKARFKMSIPADAEHVRGVSDYSYFQVR